MIIIVLTGIFGQYVGINKTESNEVLQESTVINGTVISFEQKSGDYTQLIIKDTNGKKTLIKYFDKIEASKLIGYYIKLNGKFEKIEGRRNPNCFDYRLFLKTKGISRVFLMEKYEKIRLEKPILNFIAKKKENFKNYLVESIGTENAGFGIAILYGDKSILDQDIRNEFEKNSTAHLIATSGLHMGLIYGFFCFVFRSKRNLVKNVLIILILLFFCALANFSLSVIRAFIMILVHIIALIIHERFDLLTAMSISMLIVLIHNPYNIYSISFQMSYIAVAIIAFCLPLFKNLNISSGLKNTLIPAFVIQIGMTPLTVYTFNNFSFIGFILNIPLIFLGSLIISIGVVLMILQMAIGQSPMLLTEIFSQGIKLLIRINSIGYNNGEFNTDMVSPPLFIVVLFYVILFYCFSEYNIILFVRKHYNTIFINIAIAIIIILLGIQIFPYEFKNVNVYFVDVGQGHCTVFKENGKVIMIDGGGSTFTEIGENTVKPFLLKNGMKYVDLAIATHLDTDHYRGLCELARAGMIKKMAIYEGNNVKIDEILKDTELKKSQIIYLKKNDIINIENNFKLEVIFPKQKSQNTYKKESLIDDENTKSLVMKVKSNNLEFLITGDIGKEVEKSLDIGEIDVLQIPHHGSNSSTSNELLIKTNPKVAVIQVGKNNYGHPNEEVIEKLKKECIIVYRNDFCGAIGFITNSKNIVKEIDY